MSDLILLNAIYWRMMRARAPQVVLDRMASIIQTEREARMGIDNLKAKARQAMEEHRNAEARRVLAEERAAEEERRNLQLAIIRDIAGDLPSAAIWEYVTIGSMSLGAVRLSLDLPGCTEIAFYVYKGSGKAWKIVAARSGNDADIFFVTTAENLIEEHGYARTFDRDNFLLAVAAAEEEQGRVDAYENDNVSLEAEPDEDEADGPVRDANDARSVAADVRAWREIIADRGDFVPRMNVLDALEFVAAEYDEFAESVDPRGE
jgi:hypothetical protein